MTVSLQESPQVGKIPSDRLEVLDLLIELRVERAENKRLRRRVARLEVGRARWRAEARAWKWGMLSRHPRKSP